MVMKARLEPSGKNPPKRSRPAPRSSMKANDAISASGVAPSTTVAMRAFVRAWRGQLPRLQELGEAPGRVGRPEPVDEERVGLDHLGDVVGLLRAANEIVGPTVESRGRRR